MAYVIAEPCIGIKDTGCVDACPEDCIHPKKDESDFAPQLYIDPQKCIDCGVCVPVGPVSAIFALDDLPPQWSRFAQINQEHYRISFSALTHNGMEALDTEAGKPGCWKRNCSHFWRGRRMPRSR
jgi:ferredoxin